MDKIIEIFNQVKINVLLLDAIQQVSSYAKFLNDICTQKRKTNVLKNAFLAANISELSDIEVLLILHNVACPPHPPRGA